jgi:hypothetical protein
VNRALRLALVVGVVAIASTWHAAIADPQATPHRRRLQLRHWEAFLAP